MRLKPLPPAGAFLLPALCCRMWLLGKLYTWAELQANSSYGLLRGAIEDCSSAVLLALICGLLPVRLLRKFVFGILLILWTVLCYAQYEHVMALGASVSVNELRYAFDKTFIRGSALAMTSPPFVGCLLLCLLVGLFSLRSKRFDSWGASARLGSLFALVFPFLLPLRFEGEMWSQRNFVFENAARLAEVWLPRQTAVSSAETAQRADELQQGRITGKFRGDFHPGRKNVLLIILEGISGRLLDPIARHHHLQPTGLFPFLSGLAGQGMLFPNFITQDRHTDRGEFALLCGEYSNVYGTPQMSEYARCGKKPCLASVLRSAGYQTAYVQAAPLNFMLKSDFMPAAGFSESHGTEWFTHAYLSNAWGVDDRAFFQQSLTMIDKMSANPQPWFLSLLTVGTHHPYLVSEEYAKNFADPESASRRYLDQALEEFFAELQKRDILKDTLVLVTADESYGEKNPSPPLELLSYNWGFLLALTQPQHQEVVVDPYEQVDVPLSVLDYLGLDRGSVPFGGRSVFREVDPDRRLYFANTVGSRVFLVEHNVLTISSLDSSKTISLQYDYPDLFSTATVKTETPTDAVGTLQAMRPRLEHFCAPGAKQSYQLYLPGTSTLGKTKSNDRWLIGGQHLRVPPESHIRIHMRYGFHRGSGKDPAVMALQTNELDKLLSRFQVLLPADSELEYLREFTTHTELGVFNFNVIGYDLREGDSVDMKDATMEVRPATAADRDVASLQLRNSVGAIPMWSSEVFPAASCVSEKKRIRSCPQQFVLLSPLFDLPKNSELRLRAKLRARKGAPRAILEISSQDEKTVKRQTPITALLPDRETELALTANSGVSGAALQFRLGWVPDSPDDEAEFIGGTLEITPPAVPEKDGGSVDTRPTR
jgi:hypothetical protein